MRYLKYPQSLNHPVIFILGFFDGIHQGHLSLFQKARDFKFLHPEYQIAVCTFATPPVNFLRGTREQTLFTFEERCLLFESLGVDIVYSLPINQDFLTQSAQQFLQHLIQFAPSTYFLLGEEARFGHDQKGGKEFLEPFFRTKNTHNFETLPTIEYSFGKKVSSSSLRESVVQGDMKNLSSSLSQPFFLFGKVEHGEKKGRLIGFPTLNIPYDSSKLLPPFGVYRSFTKIKTLVYHSLTYISNMRLDLQSQFPLSETWVSHFQKEIYGAEVCVYLLSYYRVPEKISSLQELKILLEQDKLNLEQKFF